MAVPPAPSPEEHTSELQSRLHLVCRILLVKKKHNYRDSRRRTKIFCNAFWPSKVLILQTLPPPSQNIILPYTTLFRSLPLQISNLNISAIMVTGGVGPKYFVMPFGPLKC